MRVLRLVMVAVAVVAAGCAAPSDVKRGEGPAKIEGKVADGGMMQIGVQSGWAMTEGGRMELSGEHAPAGQKALKVTLPAGAYPGVMYEAKGSDWSKYGALRFSVFNPGKAMKLSVRVDEAGSTNFATRYQSDMPLNVGTGENELEVSMGALRQGNLFSRGIDVGRIVSVRFFVAGLKEEAVVYLSNVRLVNGKRGAEVVELFDFAAKPGAGLEARGETMMSFAEGKKLRLELGSGNYPGVGFSHFAGDWVGYDLFSVAFSRVENLPMPENVSIKIRDRNGRQMTFSTSLVENKGLVEFPVEMAGQLSLGQIQELSVFFPGDGGKAVFVGSPKLRRVERTDFPTVHAEAAKELGLTLDFRPLAALGKSSVFMAMLAVPLADGKVRMVRCNSEVQGITVYQVPAEAFAGAAANGEVVVWGYLTEHGVWHFRRTGIVLKGGPQTLVFDDAGKFNH